MSSNVTASDEVCCLVVSGGPADAERMTAAVEQRLPSTTVATATTVSEARAFLTDAGADCVVARQDLPDGEGLALLQWVRARDGDTPFVLCVADGDQQLASDAVAAGVSEYVVGDAASEDLGDAVARALGGSRRETDAATLQRELAETRTRLEMALDAADAGVWTWDLTEDRVVRHDSALRLYGYDQGAMDDTIEAFYDLVHPDDRERVRDAISRSLEAGEPYGQTFRIERPDGEVRWIEERGTVEYDDGEPVVVHGVSLDVTERKRMENRLAEEKRTLETVLENVPAILFDLDGDGVFTRIEGRGLEYVDWDADRLVGESAFDVLADHPSIPENVERALDGERFDTRIRFEGRVFETWYEPVLDDDGEVERVVGAAVDVTERVEREEKLREREQTLEQLRRNATDVIWMNAPDQDDPQFVTEAFEDVWGRSTEELHEDPMTFVDAIHPDDRQRVLDALERQRTDPESYDETYRVVQPDGEVRWVHDRSSGVYDEDGTLERIVGVASDVTDRVEYEQTLAELHDTAEDLLRADTAHEIYERTVAAATEILELTGSGVYEYDETENVLRPAVASGEVEAAVPDLPTFGPGDAVAWEAFVDGDRRVFDDVRNAENVYNPDTAMRSELVISLGDYGVFIAGSTEVGVFDDQTVELAELLTATTEAALARADREATLRQRERQLRERTRELERVNTVNETAREIGHALVGATTRDEIEETVCERLAAIDRHAFVWIGDADGGSDRVDPTAWAGTDRGYLDAVALDEPASETADPSMRAYHDRRTVTVDSVAAEPHAAAWRKAALNRDFLSVASVPLVHDGVRYGVVTLYATEQSAFPPETAAVLAALGDTVAYAMSAVERRRALLHDGRTVEVEFGLSDSDSALLRFADAVGQPVELDGVVPQSDSTLAYVTVPDASSTTVEDAAGTILAIQAVRQLDDERYELDLDGLPLVGTVVEHGGTVRDLQADPEDARLVVTLPTTANVSSVIDAVLERYPGTKLLARRQRPPDSSRDPGDRLTERQREVLRTAYYRGFFEWPRTSSAEEVADVLGISQPTLVEHLRRAESTLLDELVASETPMGQLLDD